MRTYAQKIINFGGKIQYVFTDATNIGFIFYCGGIPLRSNLIDNFKCTGRAARLAGSHKKLKIKLGRSQIIS